MPFVRKVNINEVYIELIIMNNIRICLSLTQTYDCIFEKNEYSFRDNNL